MATELKVLELSKTALTNAANNTTISGLLEEMGYGGAQIEEGKARLETAIQTYNSNLKEGAEAKTTYLAFSQKEKQLDKIYRKHRKRAKVIFAESPAELIALDIHKAVPVSYLPWLQSVSTFYEASLNSVAIQEKLAVLKVTVEELTLGQTLVAEVEEARISYLNEKGESQDATKIKDAAFAELDKWMRNFYMVARIALEEHPQMLESLGKFVRS